MPPSLLRKSDGTTLYATRDLAAVLHRRESLGFDLCLYVVGGEQRLHFRQLKAVLERMGLEWAESVVHVDFGLIRFQEGRMSTRHGKVVFLDEVLDQAVARVREIMAEKNPDLADREAVAEAVGVGAVVFNDLKAGRVKDVLFDLGEMLRFDGGDRALCPVRRGASVRDPAQRGSRGAGARPAVPTSLCWGMPARCCTAWAPGGETLARAARENEPSVVTAHTIRLARSIHSYLQEHRVLGVEASLSKARLLLVAAARRQIEQGLGLIGLAAPEAM